MAKLSEKARRGVAVVAEMLGSESAAALERIAASEKFGARLSRLALEYAFADAWGAEGLSRREKSLLTLGALVAMRQPKELQNHVNVALANGIAPDEFEKILVHLAPYVGFPASSTARAAMGEALHAAGRHPDGTPP